jgi:predicted ATPase/DNA-binding CsgD family transcriptional regulator
MRAVAGGGQGDTEPVRPFESDIPGALPARLDSFVGRRQEMDRLHQLLRKHRLVTLVGSAGVGKTRLAVELANRLPGPWSGRVALVELDAIGDGELIPQAVAGALGLRGQPGRSVADVVFGTLRGARTVLVLDNCEHLVEPCAAFVAEILSRCRGLRIIATSRETLNIPGEMAFQVAGLSLPARSPGSGKADLLRSDAVRLFVDRARELVHDFELADDDIGPAAAICADLDGCPLAIELAARWIQMLSVPTIHARLSRRFELLTATRRTVQRRQRSLREAIDWSYQLLTPDEQVVFRRLAVLTGTFDLETALAVATDQKLDGERVFVLLSRLQATSLVVPIPGTARFRLLESVRLYAREQLDASGEADATQERLVGWLTELARPLASQPIWFPLDSQRRLEPLSDNLLTALRWTQDADDDRHALLTIATVRCWMPRGYLTDGRKLLRSALDRVGCLAGHRCLLLAYAGYLAIMQGDVHESTGLLEESLELARGGGDPAHVVCVLYTLGCVRQATEQLELAHECLSEACELARTLGEPVAVAMVTERLAWTALLRGEVTRAKRLMDGVLPTFLAPPAVHGLSLALHSAGTIALLNDDVDAAERYTADSLRAAPASWLEVPFALEGLAMVAERRGQLARSVRLFAAARAIRGSAQLFVEPIWRRQVEDSLAAAWETLGAQRIAELNEEIGALSKDQMISYALEHLWTGNRADAGPRTLTGTEYQVAELVAAGLTNTQIAARLGLSVRTVAHRLHTIRDKLDLRSRADIPAWLTANAAGGRVEG